MGADKDSTADYKVRLWGVDRYSELLNLAQGGKAPEKKAGDANKPLVTWEEFVLLFHSRKESNGTGDSAGGDTAAG